mmetsp:Transcript_2584/g.8042  ORF Transcript_2584/g.8042 Transcript_2584/m.8042 type:complete len:348 (+) Transcript_2584:49-1092(+)
MRWLAVVGLAAGLRTSPGVMRRSVDFFGARRRVTVWNDEAAPMWSGEPLRVLVWNVQYCAGIRQHFFYDGGLAVSTPKSEVLETAAEIGYAIGDAEPDLVLLQEVDRRSRRTGYVDQFDFLATILGRRGLTSRASASYWRVPYVPHPKHHHVGRIGMHLATFSRFQLDSATRWQLPLLRESRLRRLFNLRRAALQVDLKTPSRPFAVINTHLSAFSRGDGTLRRQVDTLRHGLLDPNPDSSWLLAGDFNCLSPYEDPRALQEEADLYPKDHTDVSPLYDAYNPAVSSPDLLRPTYKPFRALAPDRTIDHAFASPDVQYDAVDVLKTGRYLSDHQPLLLDISLRGSAA